MRRTFSIAAVTLAGLLNGGCATSMLIHSVGNRQEMPSSIVESYVAGNTLAISYESKTVPGLNRVRDKVKVFDVRQRQALFDLSREPEKGHTNLGQIQTNSSAVAFSTDEWTVVPRTTKAGKPDELLGTNAIVIQGAVAASFKVIRQNGTVSNGVVVSTCALPTRCWTTWWKRPVQIVGFPFALAIDVVSLPLYPICYGIYAWEMGRGYGPGNHGP